MLSVAIGPFALAVNHLVLLLALGLATLVGWLTGRRSGSNPESALFGLFLLGLLAARLGFVIAWWAHYQDAPLQALDIRDGGFLVWVGVLAVLLGGLWQGWKKSHLRKPLGMGLVSGLLFWLVASLTLSTYEQSVQQPDITLRNAAGQPVKLADYQGKPVVVNLWATWCPPCRREMPVMQAAQIERQDVVFLFVNQQEDAQTVDNFLTSQSLNLRNLLFDDSGELAKQVGSAALPTTLFYDAEGRQIGNHLGELSKASLARYLEAIGPEKAP
jgi:thiol-disulfide isomerase/thioredoxin